MISAVADWHLGTIAQLCRAMSLQLRHVSTIGKKLIKQHYLLQMSPQYYELQPTNGWDQLASWGHPSKFQRFRVLVSLLQQHHSLEANQTLHDVWPSPGLVHYLYISGAVAPWRNFCRCKIHFTFQVLCAPILAALLHSTRAVGIRQNLLHATRNGITELLQRVPCIFGWASITLGIGPHSSFMLLFISPAFMFGKGCW